MPKANNKTTQNTGDVSAFLAKVADETKRADCDVLLEMMSGITGDPPMMWGSSIVGFGSYHYKYESGREGDSLITGFSPRKQALAIYIMPGFSQYESLLAKLGKHKTGKSCLYIKRLDDVHLPTLKKLVASSVKHMRQKYSV